MRSIIWTVAMLLAGVSPAWAGPQFTVIPLPDGSYPTAINQVGQIVGDIATGAGPRGFLWSGSGITQIGTLGGSESHALGLNNRSQVVGYASEADGSVRAFVFDSRGMRTLGVTDSAASLAYGINEHGNVVGQYLRASGGYRAFLHDGTSATDLGTLGGDFAFAAAINNGGQVVGSSALDDSSPYLAHAFIYREGVMRDLGTLGGSLSVAHAINDGGQVAGFAWVAGSEHAFLYADGQMRDLGTLGGRRSVAYGLNSHGLVVGDSQDAQDFDYYAFIHDGSVMTDLNTLIDPALGWTLYSARGINDRNQIAAWGCRVDTCAALLLDPASPVPEPASLPLMLAGLGLLALASRRASYRCA